MEKCTLLFTILSRNCPYYKVSRNIRTIPKRGRRDPGISLRANLINEQEHELDPEDFENLEAEFSNVHISHKDYEAEVEHFREKQKHLIVKQKYFKQRYPNFLTWADKQQIKYLNSKEPDEWTVEKLCESFPALPETIISILKGNWTKKNENKIKNHDASVQENWISFKGGKLELPQTLSEHLHKFSNRALNLNPLDYIVEKPKVQLPQGEFSNIITSYENAVNKKKSEPLQISDTKHNTVGTSGKNEKNVIYHNGKLLRDKTNTEDTFLTSRVVGKHSTTLSQYQKNLEIKDELNIKLSYDDKLILQSKRDSSVADVTQQKSDNDVSLTKYIQGHKTISLANRKGRDYSHLVYPEKIVIPKKQKNKEFVYKLNDCYYDYDGEFLYRVPGMK